MMKPGRFRWPALTGTVLCALAFTAFQPARAAPFTVCASGCASATIQGAINAAASGDTVTVAPGVYVENITIDKPLTLLGTGRGATRILPALSNPDCGGAGGGSLCAGASNIILVQADDVTIAGFTLDGDNPALTSGVTAGGADLDARNGIITNYLSGVYDNLVVHDVRVENVYLRGIYASSGGTFDFHDNVVRNVQADPASIAMFNFGGSGVFARNSVSLASDAISANWSRGTSFLDNAITDSASGVHTDNAGGAGGVADVIRGNQVERCTADGYGVWVFVPYIAPTVEGNRVHRCATGLALFGGYNASPVAFTGNSVDNADAANSVGTLVTSDMIGYGCSNASAAFTDNTLKSNAAGVKLLQGPAFEGYPWDVCGIPGTVSATLNANDIFGNGTGVQNRSGNSVDASHDWWGCSRGPGAKGCDTIEDTAGSTTSYVPWLTAPAR